MRPSRQRVPTNVPDSIVGEVKKKGGPWEHTFEEDEALVTEPPLLAGTCEKGGEVRRCTDRREWYWQQSCVRVGRVGWDTVASWGCGIEAFCRVEVRDVVRVAALPLAGAFCERGWHDREKRISDE